jgi:hypothetical protein
MMMMMLTTSMSSTIIKTGNPSNGGHKFRFSCVKYHNITNKPNFHNLGEGAGVDGGGMVGLEGGEGGDGGGRG